MYFFYRWKDKKDVHMLNSAVPHHMVSSIGKNVPPKPLSVLTYNANMGGVDHSDKVTKPLVTERKSVKWYKKFYFHIFDLAVYNTYIIWKTLDPSRDKGYKEFLITLITEIYEENYQERKKVGRPSNNNSNQEDSRVKAGKLSHLPEKVLNKKGKPQKRDCKLCSQSSKYGKENQKKSRNSSSDSPNLQPHGHNLQPNAHLSPSQLNESESNSIVLEPSQNHAHSRKEPRHMTPYRCKECKVHLCIQNEESCFIKYHQLIELPSRKRKRSVISDNDDDDDEAERTRRERRYYDD